MLKEYYEDGTLITPNTFTEKISDLNRKCTMVLPKGNRPMPYWWDADIEIKRKECHSLRRIWTRTKRSRGDVPIPSADERFHPLDNTFKY
ncbi:hypothetical protein QE152_g14106 [Popillia japonica]|uniref:Uncharacterized protein n=1 Tax=Popillia japonica TaxID=7064 RepID=A0AAW1LBV4_POPJA